MVQLHDKASLNTTSVVERAQTDRQWKKFAAFGVQAGHCSSWTTLVLTNAIQPGQQKLCFNKVFAVLAEIRKGVDEWIISKDKAFLLRGIYQLQEARNITFYKRIKKIYL